MQITYVLMGKEKKMAIKIKPIDEIIGEKVMDYKHTPIDTAKKTSDNLVLTFESGKKLFVSSMINERDQTSVLFFSPVDENV